MPLLTYDELGAGQRAAGTIREDLMDFIENVSPKDTPLYNNLGAVGVDAGFVEHLEDTLTAAATNAWAEGGAATDVTLSTPSRNYTIIQNFQKHFWVSGRQLAVRHAGLSSMLSYQEMKNTKELKTDIELALHRGSAVSGTTTTAPHTAGLLNAISTYATSRSGVTLSEREFNDRITDTFSTPVDLREVYCNMLVKRTINNFTTNTTRFIPASDRRQVDIVDVYESEMGLLAIFKSRYQLQAASVTAQGNSWVAIDPDMWKVAVLRPFETMVLGKDGDRERRMIVGELGLLARTEKGGVAETGVVANLP